MTRTGLLALALTALACGAPAGDEATRAAAGGADAASVAPADRVALFGDMHDPHDVLARRLHGHGPHDPRRRLQVRQGRGDPASVG